MKELLSTSTNSIGYRLQFLSLCLIAVTLPFSIALNNLAIGLLILTWFFTGNIKSKIRAGFTNKLSLLFISVFLFQVVGLLYTTDMQEGLGKLERKAALFILPFVLAGGEKIIQKHLHYIVVAFIVACTALVSYTVSVLIGNSEPLYLINNLTEHIDVITGIHHAYSGMFLVFAVAAALYLTFSKHTALSIRYRTALFFISLFLYAFLILLAARTAVFTSFLLLFIFILYFLIVQQKQKYILTALLVCAAIGAIVVILPNTRTKIAEFNELKGVHSPLAPRLIKWKCAFKIMDQQAAWLYGVGTGDAQSYLQDCYIEERFWGDQYGLNAHNEYLEEMLRHGIPGMALFIISLMYPLILSFRTKKGLYVVFIVVFMVSNLTESTLSRQKGVVFYALFNSAFAFCYFKKGASGREEKES